MKKVTITVDVDGNSISRVYMYNEIGEAIEQEWDSKIVSMLDTIEKSNEEKF